MSYYGFLCIFFTWLAVQNIALPLLYRQEWLSVQGLVIAMALKEAVLLVALLALAHRCFHSEFQFISADWWALGYLTLACSYLAIGPLLLGSAAPLSLQLVSLRALVTFALFYFWGRLSWLALRDLRRFGTFLVTLQFAVAGFALFEWLILPLTFWSDTVGIGLFMLDVKGLAEDWNVADGLPSNIFRFGFRRAISTYGDPLSLGIVSVFPLLICVAVLLAGRSRIGGRSRAWWMAALGVVAAALLLTIARESIGAALIGVMLLVWWRGKISGYAIPAMVLGAMVLLYPPLLEYAVDTITFREESAATHLNFALANFLHLPDLFFGKGLGEAGGWAFSLAGVESEVGESSYFEVISQIGVPSVVLLVGFLVSVARRAWRLAGDFREPLLQAMFLAFAVALVARLLVTVFSPSLFGVIPLASFFFFVGAAFSTMQRLAQDPGVVVARRVLVLQPEVAPMATREGAR